MLVVYLRSPVHWQMPDEALVVDAGTMYTVPRGHSRIVQAEHHYLMLVTVYSPSCPSVFVARVPNIKQCSKRQAKNLT